MIDVYVFTGINYENSVVKDTEFDKSSRFESFNSF